MGIHVWLYVMESVGGVEQYREILYHLIGYAARYGHQQMSEIGHMTQEELSHFNDGVEHWIKIEKKTGSGLMHALAGG